MAEKRMLARSLSSSEKIMDCSSDSVRLLFVWLCLEVDDDGYMQCKPRTIKQRFYGYREDVSIDDCDKMLKELCNLELIVYYKEKDNHKSFIFIPGWQDINQVRKDLYKPSEIKPFTDTLHIALHDSNVNVTFSFHRVGKNRLDKNSKTSSPSLKKKNQKPEKPEKIFFKKEFNQIISCFSNKEKLKTLPEEVQRVVRKLGGLSTIGNMKEKDSFFKYVEIRKGLNK